MSSVISNNLISLSSHLNIHIGKTFCMFSLFLEVLFLAKYETNDVPWCHFKLSFIYAPYNVLPIQGLSNNRIIMKVYFDHTSRPANYNGTQMTAIL